MRRVALAFAAVLVAVLGLVATAPTSAETQQQVRIELPEPTGTHPVGSTELHLVDHARQDPWRPNRVRELMVTLTYPARQARRNAPVDRRAGALPVVLFSPGLQAPRELYSVLTDELASRGYLVVSMSHTYETDTVQFPGGRVERGVEITGTPAEMKRAIDARVAGSIRASPIFRPRCRNSARSSTRRRWRPRSAPSPRIGRIPRNAPTSPRSSTCICSAGTTTCSTVRQDSFPEITFVP